MDKARTILRDWRQATILLFVLSAAMALSQSTFSALLNNFAYERAAFSGVEIGVLHTLREVPGLLAFTVVFVLLVVREQRMAFLALVLLGAGTALMGLFPSVVGLYLTTVLASVGFHYFESIRQSLALQWLEKERAPLVLGQIMAVNAFVSLAAFAVIYLMLNLGGVDMGAIYVLAGTLTAAVSVTAWLAFPEFKGKVAQRRKIVLRSRYWLFYALTFLGGSRRQIMNVFAAFLMVEKFGFDAAAVTLMLLANYAISIFVAPRVGRLIGRWGERRVLILEYAGLVCVFTAYAFVEAAWLAVALFILDHVFFAFAIAIKTYFQKIADPADMANTAGVSSTINHVAAVFLPAVLGLVWVVSPSAVFLIGAAFATLSLACACMVPRDPMAGNEAIFARLRAQPAAAE